MGSTRGNSERLGLYGVPWDRVAAGAGHLGVRPHRGDPAGRAQGRLWGRGAIHTAQLENRKK